MKMPRLRLLVLLAIFSTGASTGADAQWLNYPTPGVPRTKEGKPNLSAPTPRTPEGKPDLSGIWEPEHNRPCPPGGCPDAPVQQEFVNIGWSLPEGLPYQPWAADLVKSRKAEYGKDDPLTHCLPASIVHTLTGGLLMKVVQSPALLVILSEANASYRQIFTDGRPLPEDPQPSFNGYSTGKWEGDTLVVQSSGFKDGIWLDRNGSPLSEAAKIAERFRRVNFGRLEIEVTVNDPKVYTKPWTVTLHQVIVLNTELMDYICLENEKDLAHIAGK
jgi:hypothetical protein